MVTHPRQNAAIAQWLKTLLDAGITVLVPEIADYEVRRELLRAKKTKGVQRLNQLKATIGYLPITTDAMLVAAQFWAQARTGGYPTAGNESLDADVILAAQATTLADDDDEPIIATTNVGHLTRFVAADNWENIQESA
jgi:predicted nucleic acid-binding protein